MFKVRGSSIQQNLHSDRNNKSSKLRNKISDITHVKFNNIVTAMSAWAQHKPDSCRDS